MNWAFLYFYTVPWVSRPNLHFVVVGVSLEPRRKSTYMKLDGWAVARASVRVGAHRQENVLKWQDFNLGSAPSSSCSSSPSCGMMASICRDLHPWGWSVRRARALAGRPRRAPRSRHTLVGRLDKRKTFSEREGQGYRPRPATVEGEGYFPDRDPVPLRGGAWTPYSYTFTDYPRAQCVSPCADLRLFVTYSQILRSCAGAAATLHCA